MTAPSLKTIRHELAEHLSDCLDIANAPWGGNVNPPCVMVRPGPQYIEASTYCLDVIEFEAVIAAGPGDLPAVADQLDDLLDGVRATLRQPSYNGFRFGWRSVEAPIPSTIGELQILTAVVRINLEREGT